jgi:PEP-CTERM motif
MRLNRATVAVAALAGVALFTPAIPASADPIVWTGPSMAFTKPDFADWMLPANQDRLTDNVWLTRGATLPLFNIAAEPFYIGGSPSDTEWAFGPTQPGNPGPISASNYANLVFDSFILSLDRAIGRNAVAYGPGVVHLISDDIYLDIRFTSWTQELGGGFSYIRSTPDQAPVPEPATATLLLVGAATGLAVRRRKQHTRS